MGQLSLQFRLVKRLDEYNRKHKAPTRNEFVDYIVKNHRHKIFYRCDTEDEYRNRINNTLGDCVAPGFEVKREERVKYFIDYDADRQSILVTKEGRQFTTWLGFVEMFLKYHSRTRQLVIWIIATIGLINWKPILGLLRELSRKFLGL